MNIIHNTGYYFPSSTGGTEVYIRSLVKELQNLSQPNIQNMICAPQVGYCEEYYDIDQAAVYRYPIYPDLTIAEIRGQKPPGGFQQFSQWLESQQANIYHQHSWTTGCGIHHLRYAKSLGLKTVVTVHVPGNVCLRGTMLLNGDAPCDGEVQRKRCSSCWAKARGVSSETADWLAGTPLIISDCAAAFPLPSRLASALATPALVKAHQNRLLEMAALSDRIVAVCQWLYDALLINGIPKEKLVLSRQGVASEVPLSTTSRKHPGCTLQIGFLGRWDPIKGIHIPVKAVQCLPKSVPVKLTIHGLVQDEESKRYRQQVVQLAVDEPRIHVAEPLSRGEILPTLANFDLLAIPSQLLETGPIVALEAQAVSTPVLGSDLGGIAELVQHGVDGWLVPSDDIAAWQQAIFHLATHREVVDQLRQGIGPVRTTQQVASEMAALYQEIL